MAELILIRHGKTAGNLLGRYIGSRTDEPLCDEGREGLAGKQLPEVERLYVSPMKRCVETAEILWPGFDRKKMQKRISGNAISETLKIRIIKNCPEMGTIRRGSTAMARCPFPMASPWMPSRAGVLRPLPGL